MYWGTSKHELYARTTLRLVCQEWNATLLRSPRCWSRISLNLEHPWLLHYALRIFMHRSTPFPLYISLTAINVPKISNIYLNRYLDLLGAAVDRWHSFCLIIGEGAPKHLLAQLDLYKFEGALALKNFCIGIRRDDEDFSTRALTPIANIIGSIPALLHLKLDWCLLSPRAAQYLVEHCRVEALKSLELRTYSASAVLVMVRFALSATSLTLIIQLQCRSPLQEHPPIFAISLRSLRYLHLTFYADRHHLLQVLRAPLLTVLCIETPKSSVPVPPGQELYTVLLQYLTNSCHSIRALIVTGIDPLNLIHFLAHPAVVEIDVVEIIFDNLKLFEVINNTIDGPEMPERIKLRCNVRIPEDYGFDVITVGWADCDTFNVFEETMMESRPPHAYGAFAHRALRWKYAVLGFEA